MITVVQEPILDYIDCQGLGGAQSLAASLEGFRLVHRASLGKFGDQLVAANRDHLPGPWAQDDANAWDEWSPARAPYLIGTPPCSGFSRLNTTGGVENKRGASSAINDCMRQLVMYAGRCTGEDGKRGVEIAAFESVQGAFKEGRGLMQELRGLLEAQSGQEYDLTHVLISGASVGAAQMRHRYYFVAHRVPFGVTTPERRRVATYEDAIGDLVGLDYAPEGWPEGLSVVERHSDHDYWWLQEQGILNPIGRVRDAYEWTAGAETPDEYIVREHQVANDNKDTRAFRELAPFWNPGDRLQDAMALYYRAHGRTPEGVENWWDATTMKLRHAFSQPKRVRPDAIGLVLTGDCMREHLHWSEPRNFTARECARLMGYPDTWRFDSCTSASAAGRFIGKCAPVQSGRWLARQVKASLLGNPGQDQEQIGDREYMHDSTPLYREWFKSQNR